MLTLEAPFIKIPNGKFHRISCLFLRSLGMFDPLLQGFAFHLKAQIYQDTLLVSHKAQCWVLFCSLSTSCVLERSCPRLGLLPSTHPLLSSLRYPRISACLADISSWIAARQLNLNSSKTEPLYVPRHACPCQDLVISLDNSQILPSVTVHNLGETTENHLSFSPHVAKLTDSCQFLLWSIRKIRSFLFTEATQVFVQSLDISRLDYYISLLAGQPLCFVIKSMFFILYSFPSWCFRPTVPLVSDLPC